MPAHPFFSIPKLGFGLMRLPKLPDGAIDVEQTKDMVDLFLSSGFTYFDTAFVYDGGQSEIAAGKALAARHPRDSFTLATKVNVRVSPDREAAEQQLLTSLERTQAGYFDFYLLHALGSRNLPLFNEFGIWDYVARMKEKGLIRHWGFSFHDSPELLDRVLTDHPDAEFVQLQINYADWESPTVASRRNLEVARAHGKPVVVMEPVRGGALANPPQRVRDILTAADPAASPASWAVRFAASQEGVMTVLSGMSNLDQMRDNVSYMKDFRPFSEKESAVMEQARQALLNVPSIPCTGCSYCTEGCPMQIKIPEIFSARNQEIIFGQTEAARRRYANITKDSAGADQCIQCGQCENACPQNLPIIDLLRQAAEAFA